MPEPTVVMDCRWLGIGGPGRTTELVLRGLADSPPAGRWVLWGPQARTAALAWPGAQVVPIEEDPRVLLGQRRALELPRGDFTVFMHQQRPLRSVPSVTVIYDTIPLHLDRSPSRRRLKRLFLGQVIRTSAQILTISEHSRACIVAELGVAAERVEVLRFPFDDAFAERVRGLRATAAPVDAALFIGGFLPHKNLPRLLAAFAATGYRRRGGRLILVGSSAGQAADLVAGLDRAQRAFVDVRHSLDQDEVDRLYATVRFVVQPSLEEGWGLPAWEGLCAGLPVCASDGGALPEVVAGFSTPFPARSLEAMTAAIDACAEEAAGRGPAAAEAQSRRLREQAPTVADFGRRFLEVVAAHVPAPR